MAAAVFPAYAGMNRERGVVNHENQGVPRIRGMNRLIRPSIMRCSRVPRIRGDEPAEAICSREEWKCSPHTRG